MKPKTIYILMIICSISLFSAARQAGSRCDKQKSCKLNKQIEDKKILPKGMDKAGYDHSPLSICLFNI